MFFCRVAGCEAGALGQQERTLARQPIPGARNLPQPKAARPLDWLILQAEPDITTSLAEKPGDKGSSPSAEPRVNSFQRSPLTQPVREFTSVQNLFFLHDSLPGAQVPVPNSFVSLFIFIFWPTSFQGD